MPLWITKSIRILPETIGFLAVLGWNDSSHFLPRADHSDLRFQTVGECMEIVAFALLFSLPGIRMKGKSDSEWYPATFRSRILVAGFVATFLLIMFWRDFFPDDHFNFLAGAMDFFYAPLGGLGIVAMSYVLGPRHGEPRKEEESSVV